MPSVGSSSEAIGVPLTLMVLSEIESVPLIFILSSTVSVPETLVSERRVSPVTRTEPATVVSARYVWPKDRNVS